MIHLLILAVHLLATITKLVHGEFVIALRLAFSWSATNERLVNAIPIVINSEFFQLSRAQHLFAGDTGYSTHFSDIKARLGSPIPRCSPWGLRATLVYETAPYESGRSGPRALDVGAKHRIGMHFGTFQPLPTR
jgi:hypothetical protein